MSNVVTITDAEFEPEVLQATGLVLVYFWATWCGPCRLMAPIVDGIAASYSDQLKVTKMEIDPNPEAVKAYRIEGVPAFRLFRAGKLIESIEGAIPKQKVEAMLSPHLST